MSAPADSPNHPTNQQTQATPQATPLSVPARVHTGVAVVLILMSAYLVTSGCMKFADLGTFKAILRSHALWPDILITPTAYLVALAEVLGGLWAIANTLAPHTLRRALLTLGLISLAFAVYASILWMHPPPKPAPCGCGISGRGIPVSEWWPLAVQNSLFAAVFLGYAFAARPAQHPRAGAATT